MHEISPEELLQRARRRDSAALADLVTLYSRRVYGLLYRLTGSRETAEDLTQETFLRLVRTIDRYEDKGKFEAWLFRIAANLARDCSRRLARRGIATSLDACEETDAGRPRPKLACGNDTLLLLTHREESERLASCLERLTDHEREILLLRHYSDLPFREIAELLGLPLGTALARAHRALKRLRAEFERTDEA